MNGHQYVRRAGAGRIFTMTVGLTLIAACLTLLAGSGPAAAGQSAAAQSVLTLRTAGDHDALWLVPPSGGAATAAGILPGLAAAVAVSPDGTTVAYLPSNGKPEVWIGHGALAPKTIPLQSAGIKTLGSMTWIAADTLLVSGSKKAKDYNGYANGLYTVAVATGKVEPFRGLSGVEPSADVTTGKIAYVQFKKLDNGSAQYGHIPKYRESLMLTTVGGSGAGRTLGSDDYRPTADYRAFSAPQLAPGGSWIIAGQTGSDVSVTYNVYYVNNDYWEPWMTMPQPTPQAAAWAPGGSRVAFAGAPVGPGDDLACVYVADVAAGALARTPVALLSGASAGWIVGLAWSDDGRLVADSLSADPGTADERVLLLDSADLSKIKDLGEGHLSVWVK